MVQKTRLDVMLCYRCMRIASHVNFAATDIRLYAVPLSVFGRLLLSRLPGELSVDT